MKIAKVSIHVVALDRNTVNTRYVVEDTLAADLEITILRMETECGLVGWGETCTAPSYYLPTLASGASRNRPSSTADPWRRPTPDQLDHIPHRHRHARPRSCEKGTRQLCPGARG